MKRKHREISAALAALVIVIAAGCDTGGGGGGSRNRGAKITLNNLAIPAPVAGETPVTAFDTDQYAGTISWEPRAYDTFSSYMTYTANITLNPKSGYTLQGVSANFFYVSGATTTTYAAGSRFVTARFPTTGQAPTRVWSSEISGVTAPVRGATPVTSITGNYEYTGTIAWSPAVEDGGTFAGATAYTATITLTANTGYTFKGVPADFFYVSGATTTNAVDSGVVTAVFPATEPTPLSIRAILGVTPPVTGATPVTTITDTAEYSGTIVWEPTVNGTFTYSTDYTAKITLTAKAGFTFTGVGYNFFTVADALVVTNNPNSGEVTATFPATRPIGAILNYVWVDEHGDLAATNIEPTLSKTTADEMVISAASGYTDYHWFINGEEDTSRAGQSTYTFSSLTREVRDYTLTLTMESAGKYFNTNINIRVVE